MAKQKARYTESEMMDFVNSNYGQSWSWKEQLSDKYSKAWQYKMGFLPDDLHNTGIKPVQVVREVLDQNYQIIKGIINGSDDGVVRARSSVVDARSLAGINFELNAIAQASNMQREMEHFVQEALLVGNSVMKVYLLDKILDERFHEFEELKEDQLDFLVKMIESDGFNEIDLDIDQKKTKTKRTTKEEQQMALSLGKQPIKSFKVYTGKIHAIAREITPVVEYIPFHEWYSSPMTFSSLDESPYFCHSYMMEIEDGLEMGWDQNKMIDSTSMNDADPAFFTDGLIVHQQYNPYNVNPDGVAITEKQKFQVYEHYCQMRYKGHAKKWWKFTTTRTQFLDEPEELEFLPFVCGKVMTLPGSFWGEGIYDIAAPLQDQLTRDYRMLNYNSANRAFGRHIALADSYDIESLLDNRPGGVIDVTQPNAISLLPEADLSQALSFEINSVQDRVQSLVQGGGKLTEDMAGMAETAGVAVSMLINKQEQGPKAYCATLAETAIVPIYKKLYMLCQATEKPIKALTGKTFANFPKDLSFTFDITTATDKQAVAQNVLSAMNAGIQLYNNGQLPPYMTAENIYDAIKLNLQVGTGDGDVSAYLTDPKTVKPSKRQIVLQDVDWCSQVRSMIYQSEALHLENQKKLAEIDKVKAEAAEATATTRQIANQIDQSIEEEPVKVGGLILENKVKAMQVLTAETEIQETGFNMQMDAVRLESDLIAEENQILEGDYAQGAY